MNKIRAFVVTGLLALALLGIAIFGGSTTALAGDSDPCVANTCYERATQTALAKMAEATATAAAGGVGGGRGPTVTRTPTPIPTSLVNCLGCSPPTLSP